jgi:outer membrane usher protein FimD/PapC
MSRSSSFDGQSSRRALASWGTSIGGVSVSASAEWQLSGAGHGGDSVYLNLSIPLGEIAGREPGCAVPLASTAAVSV